MQLTLCLFIFVVGVPWFTGKLMDRKKGFMK